MLVVIFRACASLALKTQRSTNDELFGFSGDHCMRCAKAYNSRPSDDGDDREDNRVTTRGKPQYGIWVISKEWAVQRIQFRETATILFYSFEFMFILGQVFPTYYDDVDTTRSGKLQSQLRIRFSLSSNDERPETTQKWRCESSKRRKYAKRKRKIIARRRCWRQTREPWTQTKKRARKKKTVLEVKWNRWSARNKWENLMMHFAYTFFLFNVLALSLQIHFHNFERLPECNWWH